MSRDTDQYDFFVSYARQDNAEQWISGFIEALIAEHRQFSGGRELSYFFDKQEIGGFDDWQQRIHQGLAQSRLFLAFLSPAYFASEWCRREWKAWIDTEIAKHILSSGAAPIYLVEVPGFVGKLPGLRQQASLDPAEVAQQVAELCGLPAPHEAFIAATAPILHQLRDRRQVQTSFVRPFAEQGREALRRDDLRRVLADLAQDLDERAQRVREAADSANTVPPYNRRFTGRLEELLELRRRLKDDLAGVISGVHGLGGIGKTELAFTYAHAFAGAYPGGRFLIPCEHQSELRQAVLRLGDYPEFHAQISDEERKTPETYFAAVRRCLAQRLAEKGHILLVLDNVVDPALVQAEQTDALTALGPKLHLLATTRLPPPPGSHWLTLGELPEADALELLEKHRPFATAAERDAAHRIVKRLGGFTLAVELVAAWLAAHEKGTSYAHLADQLGLEDLEHIAADQEVELRRHNHERRLSAVLGPVLRSLQPAERRALEYAALLPPDQVALPWLRQLVAQDRSTPGWAVFPRPLRRWATAKFGRPLLDKSPGFADPWQEIRHRLTRLALFSFDAEDPEPRLVRVHRLVQALLLREMSAEQRTERQQVVDALVKERVTALQQTVNWQAARWELEPLDALAWLWAERSHAGAGWLLSAAGFYWDTLAEWDRAEPPYRRALAIWEQSFGPDHPNVASALNNLAQWLQDTNRLAEAEPLMRRALAIDQASFGPHNPNVARDLNNLAGLLQATNRLAETEPLYRRALAIDEASYGPDHPEVAIDLNNLVELLRVTNRLGEAEPLLRRALAIWEQSYGPDHPTVAGALNNLAGLLQATNRLAEAEPLLRRALAIDQVSFGPDHPKVAVDLNSLATLLQDTNRLAEAEPLMRRALAIDQASFGPDHPKVAVDLNNLSVLLRATNRLAEAEPLSRRHLEIFLNFTRATGHPHPNLRDAVYNYAGLLETMGHSEEQIRTALHQLAPDVFPSE